MLSFSVPISQRWDTVSENDLFHTQKSLSVDTTSFTAPNGANLPVLPELLTPGGPGGPDGPCGPG